MAFIDLQIDVADALPFAITHGLPTYISAWVFLPRSLRREGRPVVISLLPGASLSKEYFHLQVPGRCGYSMAEHLSDRGYFVLLLDHLGTGASSLIPDAKLLTRDVAALANHSVEQAIYARLREGTLDPRIPRIPDFLKIGGGHAMGGAQVVTQQATHRSYDAIMMLSQSAAVVRAIIDDEPVNPSPERLDPSHLDYWRLDPRKLHRMHYLPDVPEDVVRLGDDMRIDIPYVLSAQAVTEGIIAEEASAIDVPVYICHSELASCPHPHLDPAYYKSSTLVTLHILARSGHCQNMSSNRRELFDYVDHWVRGLMLISERPANLIKNGPLTYTAYSK